MHRILTNCLRRRNSLDNNKPSCTAHHEKLCASYYSTGNKQKAWHLISEEILADISLGLPDQMFEVFLLILENYESLFSDTECLNQLKKTMAVLHTYPKYGDILALGTLIYWETQNTAFSVAKVDSETLMRKANHCLKIWTHWFLSVGEKILQQKKSDLRLMLSLRFLMTVAELAIINFQNFTAMTSLSYASRLAYFLKNEHIIRNVIQTIVTLIPQMGLQYVSTVHCHDPKKEDVFMDSMGLGKQSGLLCLTAMATYYVKIGQLHKFLLVRDVVYSKLSSLIPLSIRRSEIVTSISFAKAVIMRLEAEFLMMPGSRTLEKAKAGGTKPMQHALYLAKLSFAHIYSIYSKFGDNFPKVKAASNTIGPWKIVHEYLCVLKLMGEILLYTGLTHQAKLHLECGLRVADKFKLITWGAIFSSKLIEEALISDNLESATVMLQRAQSFLRYGTPTMEPGLQHCHGKLTIDFLSGDKLACGLKMSNMEMEQNPFSCQQQSSKIEDSEQHMFSNLLDDTELGRCEAEDQTSMDGQPIYAVLTDIKSCCSCCQTEIVSVCIHLMCLQAEIIWRQQKSMCSVSYFLQCSLNMAHHLVRISPCTSLINFIDEFGWKVCHQSQNVTRTNTTLAETAQKCAEIYLENLNIRSTEVQIGCDHTAPRIGNILSFLDIVETVGKKGGIHMCNISVASALLARNHCNYLSVLRNLPDDFQEAEINLDSESFSLLNTAILAARTRNEKIQVLKTIPLSLMKLRKPLETHKMSELVDLPDHTDFGSSVAESGHHTDKPSCFEELTMHFPLLAAYQNVTERIGYLQTALLQFDEFPHSLLYRKISQSLALCLWQKQMTDGWGGTSVTSSSQVQIAAHLTASMHVTFQHMMTDNFCAKLSKEKTWENYTKEAQIDKQATKEALDVLRFGGDVTENFKDRLAAIPADWTVVQMTVVNFDRTNPGKGQIFITRLNCAQEPITIGLPNKRNMFLKVCMKLYENSIFTQTEKCGDWKEVFMMDTLQRQQIMFLQGHKWLLRGQLDCMKKNSIQKFLDTAGMRAVNSILQQHGYHICYTEIRNLMEILIDAKKADVLSLVECMWPSHVTGTLTEICMDVQKEVVNMCGDQWSKKRGPVILILDKELSYFPWEGIPDLVPDTVTRIPSLVSLIALLTWHKKMARSSFKTGVERTSVAANISVLSGHSQELNEKLVVELKQYKGWEISVNDSPLCLKKLQPVLQNSSLFLYRGHGWATYTHIQKITGRTLAIMMGCDTGLLNTNKNLDGDGAALYFLMAGCPALVGNLSKSFTGESTMLISKFCSYWMSQNRPISIRELLVAASQATGKFATCGTRLVIYGLPLMMN